MHIYVVDDRTLEVYQVKILYSYSQKDFIEDNNYIYGEGYWAKTMLEARTLAEDIKQKELNGTN